MSMVFLWPIPFVKPAVTVKGEVDGKWTPHPNDMQHEYGQHVMSDNRQCQEQDTDSIDNGAAVFPFSLCLSVYSDCLADEQDADGNPSPIGLLFTDGTDKTQGMA